MRVRQFREDLSSRPEIGSENNVPLFTVQLGRMRNFLAQISRNRFSRPVVWRDARAAQNFFFFFLIFTPRFGAEERKSAFFISQTVL